MDMDLCPTYKINFEIENNLILKKIDNNISIESVLLLLDSLHDKIDNKIEEYDSINIIEVNFGRRQIKLEKV